MKVYIEVHGDSTSAPRGLKILENTFGVTCDRSRTAWGFGYEAEFPGGQDGNAFEFGRQVWDLHDPRVKKISYSAGGGH